MQDHQKKKKNQNNLEEYLVYEDKNKLTTLNTTIKVRPNGAYLALIGVDTKELSQAFIKYFLNKKTNKLFKYNTEQIVDEIIVSEDTSTLIVDIFNLPENFDVKKIVQHFRFNRDFVPDKKLRIIIIASNETLDYFSEKAYDFVTFNNFYGKFKDSKFGFEYDVNREKLDRLIDEYKSLMPNISKKIKIEKILQIVEEATDIGAIDIGLKYLKTALEKVKRIKDDFILCTVYTACGYFYGYIEQIDLASKYFKDALYIIRKFGDKTNEATLLNNLGNLSRVDKKYDIADEYLQKSYQLNKSMNNKKALLSNHLNLGINYSKMNNYDNSIKNYHNALDISKELGDLKMQAKIFSNMATLFAETYDNEEALRYINLSNEISIGTSLTAIIINNLRNKGIIYKRQLNFNLALKYLNESLNLSLELNYKNYISAIKNIIIEIENILNGIEENMEIPQKDSEFKEENIKYFIYEASNLKNENKYKEAKEKLIQAEKLADEIGLKGSQCEVYIASYDLYKTLKEEEKAQTYYNKANYIIKNSGHKLFENRLEKIKNSFEN